MADKAREFLIPVTGGRVRCVTFGEGPRPLVLLAGLSLRSLKGAGPMLARMYRAFTPTHRVFVLEAKTPLPEPCTLWRMAADLAEAMESLSVTGADLVGVSMGGMLAQCLALDWPDLAGRLVLLVTAARPNNQLRTVLREWLRLAENGDVPGLVRSSLERTCSPGRLRTLRPMLPLLTKLQSAPDLERFTAQTRAILEVDTWDRLGELRQPTLILGGEEDQIVTAGASRRMAEKLGCPVYLYPGQGHAVYEEKLTDVNRRILAFLNGEGEARP